MQRLDDKQYQKQHYREELYKTIGYTKILSFLDEVRRLGANVMCVDITHYGFSNNDVSACLYAMRGKKLVGTISKAGTKIVRNYDSLFESKGRKFLLLDI